MIETFLERSRFSADEAHEAFRRIRSGEHHREYRKVHSVGDAYWVTRERLPNPAAARIRKLGRASNSKLRRSTAARS